MSEFLRPTIGHVGRAERDAARQRDSAVSTPAAEDSSHGSCVTTSEDGRDPGMTLIELLVSVMVVGTIVTVLTTSIMVVFQQQPETQARTDVARWEQALALSLPDDLSSASEVTAEAGDTCPSPECAFGSNALWLKWNTGSGDTIVSYRYGPADDGLSYELRRVECTGGSCTSRMVLGDLSPPLDEWGNPMAWSAGDPVPEDVIDVTVPLQVGSTSPDGTTDTSTNRAKRVIVSVNGSPGLGATDRSSIVSFTAGGSRIGTIEPATFTGPQFLEATSGCGGPVTLVVDTSGSIGSAIDEVREGIVSFVRAFEGTPTQLQVVLFSTRSRTLGTSGWNKFYDLSEPAQVASILDELEPGDLSAGGGTNWEDALFRTFHAPNGQTYDEYSSAAAPAPELVVFFTDGEPTIDRAQGSYYTGDSDTIADNPTGTWSGTDAALDGVNRNGTEFSPRAWKRADNILDAFRDVRTIGVGVGGGFRSPDNSPVRTRVERVGWPTYYSAYHGGYRYYRIPHEVFLGDLVTGGNPSKYPGGASGNYVLQEYEGSWGDVSEADLLVTNDFTKFGAGLAQIALSECGGSLTVQTRDGSGSNVDETVTYAIGEQTVTTSRLAKSGTFDIAIDGVSSQTVDLVPQSLDGTGLTATGWSCRSGGVEQTGAYTRIDSGDASKGITVTVTASQAMACTMEVS